MAIYWVEEGHHDDHFDEWARTQVRGSTANGRGFAERKHAHTILYDHIGAVYRDADPVPVDLALDPPTTASSRRGSTPQEATPPALHAKLAESLLPELVKGSSIEIASSWTPSAGENDDEGRAHGPRHPRRRSRAALPVVLRPTATSATPLDRFRTYTDAVEKAGLADVLLVAPFFRTVVGTDTYVDQLW